MVKVEFEGGEVWVKFGGVDLVPVDEVEVFFGFDEGEDFDAEGGEDEVGVPGAAEGDAGDEGGDEEGWEGHPGVEGGVSAPPVREEDEGEGEEEGGDEEEGLTLCAAGEAEFFMRFGEVFRAGHGCCRSEVTVGDGEGVSLVGVAGAEAFDEPAEALFGGAVAEGFFPDTLAGATLEGVISDGAGGVHGFFDVAFFEEVGAVLGLVFLVGVVGPDAGVEVGLEFEFYRKAIVFLLGDAATGAVDFLGHAGEFLDVVADFVGDDVGVGEVSAAAEFALHLFEEVGVEVDGFFGGDVEGAHAGVGGAAAAHAGHAVVVDELRGAVGEAVLLEDFGPDFFGGAGDGADEVVDLFLFFGEGLCFGLGGAGCLGELADDL